MNETNVIDKLIGQMATEEQERIEALTAECNVMLEEARTQARELLEGIDGLYETLQPYIQEGTKIGRLNSGRPSAELKWHIQSDELQLSPLVINLELPTGYQRWGGTYVSAKGNRFALKDLHTAIVVAREYYPEWYQKRVNEFKHDRMGSLSFWTNTDEERMLSAYAELIEALPEETATFDYLRDNWFKNREAKALEERQRAEYFQKEAYEKDALLAKWVEYLKTDRDIRSRNHEKALSLQNEYDQPIEAYLLTYSVIGSNDDDYPGEHYVETQEVWVKHHRPDDADYWERFDGRKVKYLHLVSIEKRTIKPTDGIPYMNQTVGFPQYGFSLKVIPGSDLDELNAKVEALDFECLPEKPKKSVDMNYSTEDQVIREAREQVLGFDDNIDF